MKSLFKAYYSQLDEPPGGVVVEQEYSERNDECLVFTPAFLTTLREDFLARKSPFYEKHNLALVCYIDANGIKEINDRLKSHATGNEVIRAIGRWIHDNFKDLFEKNSLLENSRFWVVRWGGDEFIIMVATKNAFNNQQRQDFETQLRTSLHQLIDQKVPVLIKGLQAWRGVLCPNKSDREMEDVLKRVGAAGGWSWTDRTLNYEGARNQAERAMYVAKSIMKYQLAPEGAVLLGTKDIDKYTSFLEDLTKRQGRNN